MQFSQATVDAVEQLATRRLQRADARRPVTRAALQSAVEVIVANIKMRASGGPPVPSLSRLMRGLMAIKKRALVAATAEDDARYVKEITTSTAPGQYLVPQLTADSIITQLQQYESFRAAGARIWPMAGVQKLVIPVGLSAPSFVWMTQNSRQSATDPNFASISFDLKNLQSFELAPVQLFRTTRPEFDLLLEDVYASALGDAADAAIHSSTQVANAPKNLMSASATFLTPGNGANGGNLAYSDLLAVIQKASDLKLKPPYAWLMSGRSWNRILSLQSTTSQPIVVPGLAAPPAVGTILGFPAYLSANISSSESVGSGSNQSHIIFTNPKCIHIGENAEITISLSDEFAFDANQISVRINRYTDWDFQPVAGIVILQGVN